MQPIVLKLRNEKQNVSIKLEGVDNSIAKEVLQKVFQSFLDSIEVAPTESKTVNTGGTEPIHVIVDSEGDVKDLSNTPFGNVGEADFIQENLTEKNEIDYQTEFNNTDMTKYNREYPKLKNALARNLYNRLVELQINQMSYFVTEKGDLKLQARYSCKCGNFKKHWVVYPDGKKSARCDSCHKVNPLVSVSEDFPSTDEFGNFYVTSDMLKKAKIKEESKDTYIAMY